MSNKVGEVSVDLVLNKQQFTKEVKNVPREVNAVGDKISSAFSKIGKAVAAAFSVAAITKFTKKLVETTAQINAANSQFTQTFGDLSDSATAAMKRVADESGIVKTRLQGVGTSIYAFAKTTGMDSVSALNMMEEALQVTADSAAYYDRSLEDVSESLKSFLKGNYANDAALGLSCTETTRNAAANRLYGKSFRDLSEAQKQLTLLQMVKDANAASGALGQAAREADGLENVVGNLKEAWNQLLAVVGKPVLNAAVTVIQRITGWLQRMTLYAKAAVSALSELFGWKTEDNSAKAAKTTSDAIASAVDNETSLSKAVKKTNDEVKRGLASFDRLNVITESKSSSSDDDETDSSSGGGIDNPLASNLGDTIEASVDLDTSDANIEIDRLKDKFKKLLQPLVDFYNKHIKPIVDAIEPYIERMKNSVSDWLDNLDLGPLQESIAFVADKVGEFVKDMMPHIEYFLEEVVEPIGTELMEKVLPSILGLIGHIFAALSPIIDGLLTMLRPIWENILKPALTAIAGWIQKIGDKIGPKIEALGEKIGNLFEKLAPIVEILSKILGPAILAIVNIIGGQTMTHLTLLIDTIGDIVDALSGLADSLTGILEGDWEKAWKGAVKYFAGIVNLIIDLLNGLWQGVYYVVALIYNTANGIVEGLGNLLGQDWGWEMPAEAPLIPHIEVEYPEESSTGGEYHDGSSKIGHYASGGIFTAPTLAIVGDNAGASSGDPEVVSPLSKLQGMMNTGSEYDTRLLSSILDYLKKLYELFIVFRNEGGGSFQFVAQLDGNTLFEEFVDQVNLYKRRHRGALPW